MQVSISTTSLGTPCSAAASAKSSIEIGYVADLAAHRPRDLEDRLREREEPGPGELVELADVPIVGQRRDRYVGDVVGVDERLGRVCGRKRDLARLDLFQPVVLAEVLGEPGRAQDRQLGAGVAHGPLRTLGLFLAAPGQQDETPNAALYGQVGERAQRLRGAGNRVPVMGDVGRSDPFQNRAPGGAVLPIEARLARARADANGQAACGEALHDSAAGLAGAAKYQRG